MKLFTSSKERRFWVWASAVVLAIHLTASISQPLAGFLRERGLLEISFMLGMVLVTAAIFTQRVKTRPGWGELGEVQVSNDSPLIGGILQSKAMPPHSHHVLVIRIGFGNALAQTTGQRINRLLGDSFCLILGPHR